MWNQKQLMLIVWPAFMSACLLELVVFALVDPLDLHWSASRAVSAKAPRPTEHTVIPS